MEPRRACQALGCTRLAYRAKLLDGPDGETSAELCQEHLIQISVSGGYTIVDGAVIITRPV